MMNMAHAVRTSVTTRRKPAFTAITTAALVVLAASCSAGRSTSCEVLRGKQTLYRGDLIEVVDAKSALARLLDQSNPPPGEARVALEAWFHSEWRDLVAELPATARVWWFRESKGSLGFRQGIAAVDGCRVLGAVTLIEDN